MWDGKKLKVEDDCVCREEGGWCSVKEMEMLDGEGVDIDNIAGVAEAHVLPTPVPYHFTCPRHGNLVGETSFPELK